MHFKEYLCWQFKRICDNEHYKKHCYKRIGQDLYKRPAFFISYFTGGKMICMKKLRQQI